MVNWILRNNQLCEIHSNIEYINGISTSTDWKSIVSSESTIYPKYTILYDGNTVFFPKDMSGYFIFRNELNWPIEDLNKLDGIPKNINIRNIDIIHNSVNLIDYKIISKDEMKEIIEFNKQDMELSKNQKIPKIHTAPSFIIITKFDGLIEIDVSSGSAHKDATINIGDNFKVIVPSNPGKYKYFIHEMADIVCNNIDNKYIEIRNGINEGSSV